MVDLKKIKLVIFDFDGVFTDNRVYINEHGEESAACSRADGFGLRLLDRCNIKSMILSTEVNPIVLHRAKKLKIPAVNAIHDKWSYVKENLLDDFSTEEIAFVGNDINDIECMENVGLAVAVNDAYPAVKKIANVVLEKNGGFGAVREFCEKMYEEVNEKLI